ncbi:MAG TPA: ATP-binding protein, partial [Candidatus Binatia bacterium]|nr:ATP-binding protein [Candidatus Binatia bacterium]
IGASKIARDVTERARAEHALRETTDVLETLNRTSTVLSAELELEKVVQTVVDAATGLIGARFGVFVHNEGAVHAVAGAAPVAARGVGIRALELFARTLRGKGVVRLDDLARLPRFRGTAKSLRVRSYLAAPVVSRGAVIGGLFFGHSDPGAFSERDERLVIGLAAQAAIAIDNARLYEAERAARRGAEAASRAKDEFLSVVSHELRTPLSPILTWTRMLREHRLGEDKRARALATIERCARTQAQLIEDLLDVSRIVAGKLRLDLRPVRLAAVLEAAVEVVRPAAEAKAIRLSVIAHPDVGPVTGDAERIQQVVWNLLSNAIKFTPEQGSVTIALDRDRSSARIVVKDTGKGIARDLLPHVFERFRQGDTSASRSYGGLGLGLAIVRHLVEAHGGTVAATSAGENRGATFTVRLPLVAARAAVEADIATPAATRPRVAEYASLGGLRVLVVDDEPDSSEAVRELLASCDADVEVAGSAEHARDVLRRWDAHVVVSDVGMPGEDGFDFIASLRGREDGAAPAAVALTAYASRADKIRLLAAGFQAHVPKPVDGAELVRVVADVARSGGRL